MAFEIKNSTPLLVRHPTSLSNIETILGWGTAEGTCRDGADGSESWSWYGTGDSVDMRTIRQYITDNPHAIRLTIFFDYGSYIRYTGVNALTFCPDYFPRTCVKYARIEDISQPAKGIEDEILMKEGE